MQATISGFILKYLYLEKSSKIRQSEALAFLLMAPSNQDNRYLFISKWGLLFPSALTRG